MIKVGFLGHTLHRHSVGYLCRHLLAEIDQSRIQPYVYRLGQAWEDSVSLEISRAIAPSGDSRFYNVPEPGDTIRAIAEDKIDILIDLDSITHATTCGIVGALKGKLPIVSWLGFDASGMADYFVGDRYTFHPDADQWYKEKLIRMPGCYIATKGVELGIATTSRDRLGIPAEAPTFLIWQKPFKTNPYMLLLYAEIMRRVPSAYALVKCFAGDEARGLWLKCFKKNGIDASRVKFLEYAGTQEESRADMAIADIYLDSFPYNGTTTTIEALWQGIPCVSMVGLQWASRQGYSLLSAVNSPEGIAHTAEEFIAKAVRLADPWQRLTVRDRLLNARHTSPLWDVRRFALDFAEVLEAIAEEKPARGSR